MKSQMALRTVDQVRALADPLRLRIVEALVPAERAALDLARLVGVPVTRVYHHLDLLLAAGLIAVVRRVPRRGMEERIFRASARRYVLAEDLIGADAAASSASLEELARTVMVGGFDALIEGLRAGRIDPGVAGRGVLLQNRMLRISPAGFEALTRELPVWLDDFARRHRAPGSGGFRLALALFPGEQPDPPKRPDTTDDQATPRRARRPRR